MAQKFPHFHRFIAALSRIRFKQLLIVSAALTFFCMYLYYTVNNKSLPHMLDDQTPSRYESTDNTSGFLPPHPAPLHIEQQLKDWEHIVQTEPGYRDGYIYIAALSFQLRKIPQAKSAIQKALKIDPNFEPAQKLYNIIENYED